MPFRTLSIVAAIAIASTSTIAEASPPPPLRDVVDAARRAQGLDGPLDEWSSRARWRAALPRFGGWVGGDRTGELDLTFRESTGVIDQGVLIVDGTQNTTEDDMTERFAWRVTATWDLRDLVFSNAELAAAREARARQAARVRLDMHVVGLYRDWLEAQRGATSTDRSSTRVLQQDDAGQAFDELDILTGGWLSRRVADETPSQGGQP
jgi:hypothetical protein